MYVLYIRARSRYMYIDIQTHTHVYIKREREIPLKTLLNIERNGNALVGSCRQHTREYICWSIRAEAKDGLLNYNHKTAFSHRI